MRSTELHIESSWRHDAQVANQHFPGLPDYLAVWQILDGPVGQFPLLITKLNY
jgi:hypothetical protein